MINEYLLDYDLKKISKRSVILAFEDDQVSTLKTGDKIFISRIDLETIYGLDTFTKFKRLDAYNNLISFCQSNKYSCIVVFSPELFQFDKNQVRGFVERRYEISVRGKCPSITKRNEYESFKRFLEVVKNV